MAPIKTQMIDFASNGGTTPGYLALPEDDGSYPAVVTIQEWWGLVPHIKDVAERFARQGFVVLAPDLYHGQTAAEPDEARKLAMELDRERAVAVPQRYELLELETVADERYVEPLRGPLQAGPGTDQGFSGGRCLFAQGL